MLTVREVRQRCEVNRVRLQYNQGEYRVTLIEWPVNSTATEARAYYTDDLEDAMLTGAQMRKDIG
jgi:hypothetical protein